MMGGAFGVGYTPVLFGEVLEGAEATLRQKSYRLYRINRLGVSGVGMSRYQSWGYKRVAKPPSWWDIPAPA